MSPGEKAMELLIVYFPAGGCYRRIAGMVKDSTGGQGHNRWTRTQRLNKDSTGGQGLSRFSRARPIVKDLMHGQL